MKIILVLCLLMTAAFVISSDLGVTYSDHSFNLKYTYPNLSQSLKNNPDSGNKKSGKT